MSYTIPTQLFGVSHICHFDFLSLILVDLRCGGVGWKLFVKKFQKGGGGRVPSEILMILLSFLWQLNYILIPVSPCIFSPSNNIKFENYPLSLKFSRKALALLKQIGIYFNFLLTYTYSYGNLKTFHETSEQSKTEKRLKVVQNINCIYNEKYVKFPVTNKTGKLNV